MYIVVGVSGGIAAYKSVQIVRLLVQRGHEVHVVPTDDALRFVGLATWEAISRHPVTTSVHDDVAQVRHVALGQAADLVIVAPATANTIAGMAAGLAGNLLGTTLLSTSAPVVIAPAMHTEMWRHPATVANVATLRDRGVRIVGPADGPLTGGDSGPGRMAEPDDIVAAALAAIGTADDLTGLHVAVSTGGTREPIDPVRFLGNRSSGRQGVALALAAARRGASVTLVAAHTDDGVLAAASAHARIEIVHVGTAAELASAMTDAATGADVVVMAAAVADYRVAQVSDRKLRKEDGPLDTLALVPNDDVLAALAAGRRPGQTVVGFAAETADDSPEHRIERARRKRERKGADLLVVNDVSWTEGFGAVDSAATIIGADGSVVGEPAGSKDAIAESVWDAVVATRR